MTVEDCIVCPNYVNGDNCKNCIGTMTKDTDDKKINDDITNLNAWINEDIDEWGGKSMTDTEKKEFEELKERVEALENQIRILRAEYKKLSGFNSLHQKYR